MICRPSGHHQLSPIARLDDVSIHQIRHSVAVRMLTAGQPIEAVAQYLGHSNTAITYRTYARFMPEHLAGAAEILNFDRFSELGRISRTVGK
ncbi:MAG TPA: tyrosine-type recombinase/integrase [Paracoccus sp.]|nr:tyrosine-type recombinase/integrase [Paracoccus sp. (in: a-proteobacteria)]